MHRLRISNRTLALSLSLIALSAWLAWTWRGNVNEDAHITYRYAQNLLAGRGFVFNPGERVLATTTPLQALVLAAMGLVTGSRDFQTLALVLGWLCSLAICGCVWSLLARRGLPVAGFLAALGIAVLPATYLFAPLEVSLGVALVWGTLILVDRHLPIAAGVVGALAVVTRGDLVFGVAAAFGAALLTSRITLRGAALGTVAASAVAGSWGLFCRLYFGAWFPLTASTKTGWAGNEWMFLGRLFPADLEPGIGSAFGSTGSTILLVLAAIGIVRAMRCDLRIVAVTLIGWLVSLAAAYTALRLLRAPGWYYYPFHVGVVVFGAIGLETARRWIASLRAPALTAAGVSPSRLAVAVASMLVACAVIGNIWQLQRRADLIPSAHYQGERRAFYESATRWLLANTPHDARVASVEVGMLAYLSNRYVFDRMGLASPSAAAEMHRTRDTQTTAAWTIATADPDYFVVPQNGRWEPRIVDRDLAKLGWTRVYADLTGVQIYAMVKNRAIVQTPPKNTNSYQGS